MEPSFNAPLLKRKNKTPRIRWQVHTPSRICLHHIHPLWESRKDIYKRHYWEQCDSPDDFCMKVIKYLLFDKKKAERYILDVGNKIFKKCVLWRAVGLLRAFVDEHGDRLKTLYVHDTILKDVREHTLLLKKFCEERTQNSLLNKAQWKAEREKESRSVENLDRTD